MLNLSGKNALVTGIANNKSIAWGIAQQLHAAGANIGITYLPDEKGKMERKVAELVEPLNPSIYLPLNVQDDAQIDQSFAEIGEKWGRIDILIHCLAFANKEDLSGDFSKTSRAGFAQAMDISTYSLTRLAGAAKPLMTAGGSINGISAGPIRTLASSAVGGILDMIHHVEEIAPLRRTVTQTEVGNTAAFLCSELSSGITGQIIYVDAGYETIGM